MIVTITCKEGRKIIDRFDVNLPIKYKWIAQDENGHLEAYINKPYYSRLGNYWISGYPLTLVSVATINPDWKDSLIKVSDIK